VRRTDSPCQANGAAGDPHRDPGRTPDHRPYFRLRLHLLSALSTIDSDLTGPSEAFTGITAVGIDGDDTLWHSEPRFQDAQQRLREILAPYADGDRLDRCLLAVERRNLRVFGYGIKGFTLSMVETAIELSGGRVSGAEIQRLFDLSRQMMAAPTDLLPGVRDAIEQLAQSGLRLLLITKGDLMEQESSVARSGLAELFDEVEIVSEKHEATYHRVLRRHQVEPEQFLMAGNSVRSDVLPVLALGGAAAHVPYPLLWELERAELPPPGSRFVQLRSLADLLDVLPD
jgi:putative hydrolase of the HAD superfamily